jgi:hypothetical protein
MRRRRRNGDFGAWCSAHPWMTFFLVSSALAIPYYLAQAAAQPSSPPPINPSRRLPSPPPDPVDKPTEFTPGGVRDLRV